MIALVFYIKELVWKHSKILLRRRNTYIEC